MTSRDTPSEPNDEIALYCGRLACRKVIVQTAGRGRRKEFCSETCRRAADRNYKRAKGLTALFEEQLHKSRHEVAAYGRKADEDQLTTEHLARLQTDARVALASAAAVTELGASPERTAAELQRLVAAIRPLIEPIDMRAPARSA